MPTITPDPNAGEIYNQALKERVSSANPYQGADGNTYQTTRFKDNSLGTINTSTGDLVGGYYSESQRNAQQRALAGGNIGDNTKPKDLYGMGESGVQNMISKTGQDYANAVSSFNSQNIADSIRLRTGGTKDLDANIENLKMKQNSSRPELMKKYSDIKDPTVREQLIRQEENRIGTEVNNLNAIRNYRIGTIQDMINGELANKQQTINRLQAQYNLYKDVMGDLKGAEKTKREIESHTLDMEKSRVELEYYKSQLPLQRESDELKVREQKLGLATKEGEAGLEYVGNDARTNRHNNPTAFTTDIAKQGGLVEGVDYTVGDAFGSNGQYKTARIIGDPIDATKKVIDKIGFTTQKGANRWTYTDSIKVDGKPLNNANWKTFTPEQKQRAIAEMYKHETTPTKRNFEALIGTSKSKVIPGTGYKKTSDGAMKVSDITTPDQFKQALAKTADSKKLYDQVTPEQALNILKQDKGYSLIGNSDLLDKASTIDKGAVDGYKFQKITNDFSSAEDTKVITLVETLQAKKIANDVIKSILEKAGVLKRDYFKSGFFNDSDGYDKLQELGIL